MIAEPDTRLGRNGCDEIKNHPFFDNFDWDHVRKQKAPYVPNISSEISAENFDKFDEEEPFFPGDAKGQRKAGGGANRKFDMHFIGYTYKADVENEKSMLVNVLKDLDSISESQISTNHSSQMIPSQKQLPLNQVQNTVSTSSGNG
jgi:hypothetical protein